MVDGGSKHHKLLYLDNRLQLRFFFSTQFTEQSHISAKFLDSE